MIEHQARWEDVLPGHHIKDKTGQVWTVDEFEQNPEPPHETRVHMHSGAREGVITQPEPLAPVTIVILSIHELFELELEAKEEA